MALGDGTRKCPLSNPLVFMTSQASYEAYYSEGDKSRQAPGPDRLLCIPAN